MCSSGSVDAIQTITYSRQRLNARQNACSQMEQVIHQNIKKAILYYSQYTLDICKLPLVVPSKREQAETIRYYYDPAEFKCKPFTYYGVSGNGNNFEFIEECQVSCQVPLTLGRTSISLSLIYLIVYLIVEQCSLIPEKGPCRGSYERWYFDSKLGICKTFVYGGCLKNNNNHMSEKDCFGTCVKPKQSGKTDKISLV